MAENGFRTDYYATHGVMEKSAFPGLKVEGVGVVPLPLTTVYAELLISVANQSPFGKGEQTVRLVLSSK